MKYHVVGAEYSKYYIQLPDLESRYLTPRHDSPEFVSKIVRIAKNEHVRFIHPQPSSEALVLCSARSSLPAPVFLPGLSVMRTGQDKLLTQKKLQSASVPVARTMVLKNMSDLDTAFDSLSPPVWIRARHGAGGRLSLKCGSLEEGRDWVDLWHRRGTDLAEFIVQEYLGGRNVAWDSLWRDGKLVTSYARERLEYPFKHISPSGITGTPSVARTVHEKEVNRVGERSVRAISGNPNGAFSVDMKADSGGRFRVSEVDPGKFHTTMPLWGYAALKNFKLAWYANLADLYVRLGLGADVPKDIPRFDLLPAGYYMIRNIDSGVLLWREDGWKERVL